MKAILIDPITKTVSKVDYSGHYQDIYKHLGCNCFTIALCVDPDNTGKSIYECDALFVDDEGLLINPNPLGYFRLPGLGYPGTLAGRGLIVGPEVEEKATAARTTVAQIYNAVEFVDNPEPSSIEPTITITDLDGNTL